MLLALARGLDRTVDWFRGRSTSTTTSPAQWFIDWISGGDPVASGVKVNTASAMRNGAVMACVKVRSEDVAKLPLHLYRRTADGGKIRATNHPLYRLLHLKPNPRHTSFEFREMMQASIDLRGNAFALIEENNGGQTTALWPLNPDQLVEVGEGDGPDRPLFYKFRLKRERMGGQIDQETVTIPERNILHLRGLMADGISGLSQIAQFRETIGLNIAMEKHAARSFGNAARLAGVLAHPAKLTPEAQSSILKDWNAKFAGVENVGKTALLAEGMKFEPVQMTHEDAEFLESRKFGVVEIARMWRVPPHKIGSMDAATFSNIEHQALEYVQDSLLPTLTRWKQRLNTTLLTEREQQEFFFDFVIEELLRGDFESRMRGYAVGRNWGWLSANDVRKFENLDPIGDDGDEYLRPMNTVPLGEEAGEDQRTFRHTRSDSDAKERFDA